MNYYDWQESTATCSHCGWQGKGKEAVLGEMFQDGAEYDCPDAVAASNSCCFRHSTKCEPIPAHPKRID